MDYFKESNLCLGGQFRLLSYEKHLAKQRDYFSKGDIVRFKEFPIIRVFNCNTLEFSFKKREIINAPRVMVNKKDSYLEQV
jgi:hypothetical protein